MFSRISIILILLIFSTPVFAQKAEVSGSVNDQSGQPLTGVSVVLSGPSFRLGMFTDTSGRFSFIAPQGSCLLDFSFTGYRKHQLSIEVKENPVKLAPVVLQEEVYLLTEAVVRGKRSAVRFEGEKTVISPAGSSVMSQSDGFNVIKNIPGVFAGEEGEIRVNGQKGVTIQIDGKEVYLSGIALVNFLKSLAPGTIERIEVNPNPGSSQDASARAGVINIVLKRNKEENWLVNSYADFQKSRHQRRNWGLNLSRGKARGGFSLDYSGGISDRLKHGTLTRNMAEGQHIQQKVALLNQDKAHHLRALADFKLSEKVLADVYVSRNFYSRNIPGSSSITFYDQPSFADSVLNTNSLSHYKQITYTGGVRGKYSNEKKQELTVSANGLAFSHRESLLMAGLMNNYASPVHEKDTTSGRLGDKISSVTLQGDWSSPLMVVIDFKAGIKQVFLSIDNYAVYSDLKNNEELPPSQGSIQYGYKEAVSAAYVRVSGKFRKWNATGGLRMENTMVRGDVSSVGASDTGFLFSYIRFFPSASISYRLTDTRQLTLNYGRYITRPNYRDLSPSGYMADKYTMVTGNAALQPEMTHNLELIYIPGRSLRGTISYSQGEGTVGQSFRVRGNGGLQISPENMASRKTLAARVDGSDFLNSDKWKPGVSVSMLYAENSWLENKEQMKSRRLTPLISLNNVFVLGKDWTADLTAYYNGYMALGQMDIPAVWSASCGIGKKMMNKKLSARLFANDLFATIRERNVFKNNFITGSSSLRYEETFIGLSLAYSFRKGKQKEAQEPVNHKDNRMNF